MQHTVGISDAKVASSPDDTIATYSLGSCIGVMMWDPTLPIAGLLHFQLPSASMDADRAAKNPFMFGDSGLQKLLEMLKAKGANPKRIRVKIAGGAKMFEDASGFDIGKRNHTAIRKALWQAGLFLDKEDCGGNAPRTVIMNVNDGRVTIKSGGATKDL
jgi:chemotaxis protein CheD